ncbi:polysaccharide deacetylase family protein [Aquimarina algicola]|uniref:DUF7033 domain-containing protein n=1 Tax=Aquimarina algicola TaxID=2589995 RepID=A0A504IYU8_9FLAO|nr:polysaccharide deacetylase family protein [Aquimarina algicola]TPN81332.1 hypothetical protein FHK87_25435 [Aquimarina algicola]
MLLIHVQKVTPRVSYTFKQICKRILGFEVDLTSKIESFIAHDGPKFSYGKQPLGKELYFQSVDLLFQQGLDEVEIHVFDWEETKCFFEVKHSDAAMPFDIFAATFYLLSRYEEYLPHVKDSLGRFPGSESLGYMHNFLQDPIIDIWAYKFKNIITEKYPDIKFLDKKFTTIPVISITQTFVYKNKGILRSIGGILRDLGELKLERCIDRIKVILGLKKDPYDIFDFVIELQKNKERKAKVLFGLGDYSTYEKNISYNHPKHQNLIKHIADYVDVGLKISFEALNSLQVLKKEKLRIEAIQNRRLQYTMCSFFKIRIPGPYRDLIELEVAEDYSMGYSDYSGFRAGTCTPFMFYDLDYEVQTPLMVFPFCFAAVSNNKEVYREELVKKEILEYRNKVKKVNGNFIPIFSNSSLSDLDGKSFWKSILTEIWNTEDE